MASRKSSKEINIVKKSNPPTEAVLNEHQRHVRSLHNNMNGQGWQSRQPSLTQSEDEHLDNFPSSPANFEWMNLKPDKTMLSLRSDFNSDAAKSAPVSGNQEEELEYDFETKGSLLVNPPTPVVPPSSTMLNENLGKETYYFASTPPTAGDGDATDTGGLAPPLLIKSSALQIANEKLPEKMTICPAASVNSQADNLPLPSPPPRRRTLVERSADYKRTVCRPLKVTCIPPCPCLRSRQNPEPWRICWGCGSVYRKQLPSKNGCRSHSQQTIPRTCYSSCGYKNYKSCNSARIEGSEIVFKLFPVINVYQREKEKPKTSSKPKESGDTGPDKKTTEGDSPPVDHIENAKVDNIENAKVDNIENAKVDYDSSVRDSSSAISTDYETEEVSSDSDF